jgi:hypothetical protein
MRVGSCNPGNMSGSKAQFLSVSLFMKVQRPCRIHVRSSCSLRQRQSGTVDLTMSVPTLTDLIIFNPTLKYVDTDSLGRLSLVDKEDYDEVSQVFFADGIGLRNSRGETEWNNVLRQMGLAKGLMGFMK